MQPLVIVNGVIRPDTVQGLIQSLRSEMQSINVLIDSPGGEFTFFSVLGPQVIRLGPTMIAGNVRSAAVILYMLGHHRIASPNSSFFFHEVRVIPDGLHAITLTDLEGFEDWMERKQRLNSCPYERLKANLQSAQNWFVRFMSQHTGIEMGVFLNLMRGNVWLDAHEAKYYGVVHKIVDEPIRQDHVILSEL